MAVLRQPDVTMGVSVPGFDPASATDQDFADLRALVYSAKLVLLKNQHMTPAEFVDFGRRMGRVEEYYEQMYHHPEHPEIFVSSNVPADGKRIGVPRTGAFWHNDYAFMPNPFSLTIIYPQVVPVRNRGTYFIDMGKAYERLPDGLKASLVGARARHTPRKMVKIRPTDVYRPIGEIIEDIEKVTPPVSHPAAFKHPVTAETVLYITHGFTSDIRDAADDEMPDEILQRLLAETGQLDPSFTHENIHLQEFERGDILVWDNRSLIHRARHTTKPEPTSSFRLTVHDEHPFYHGIGTHSS